MIVDDSVFNVVNKRRVFYIIPKFPFPPPTVPPRPKLPLLLLCRRLPKKKPKKPDLDNKCKDILCNIFFC